MRSYSSSLLMCAVRRNSSGGSNLRCSCRTESILVLGAGKVTFSAMPGLGFRLRYRTAFYCDGEENVCPVASESGVFLQLKRVNTINTRVKASSRIAGPRTPRSGTLPRLRSNSGLGHHRGNLKNARDERALLASATVQLRSPLPSG